MPEGVGYGPQYTASIGLNLNYIGNNAYAFSGAIGANNNVTTLLEFSTESNNYVLATLTLGNSSGSGDDMEYEVNLNGIKVLSLGVSGANAMPPNKPVFLIPPNTGVLITAANLSSSTTREVFAILVGNVYGKID